MDQPRPGGPANKRRRVPGCTLLRLVPVFDPRQKSHPFCKRHAIGQENSRTWRSCKSGLSWSFYSVINLCPKYRTICDCPGYNHSYVATKTHNSRGQTSAHGRTASRGLKIIRIAFWCPGPRRAGAGRPLAIKKYLSIELEEREKQSRRDILKLNI